MEMGSNLYENTMESWKLEVDKKYALVLITMVIGSIGLLSGTLYGAKYSVFKQWFGWLAVLVSIVGVFWVLVRGH